MATIHDDTSSVHADDIQSPVNLAFHDNDIHSPVDTAIESPHSIPFDPDSHGASLWQAEQSRIRYEQLERAAFHELSLVLRAQSAEDDDVEHTYFSSVLNNRKQYDEHWLLITAALKRVGLTGSKLAL